MALHTGVAEERADDYVGPPLYRVHRLLSAGHGGQILLTATTYELVRDTLPGEASLRDLGEHRLKDLIRPEHVWQVAGAGLSDTFPALKTLDARPHNLPVQPTPLIGRETEIAAVTQLLRRPAVRLVTLTGAGGSGKTRLALQVAADRLEDLPNGAWFVDLAPLSDPALVPSAIATALGVREAPGRSLLQVVQDYLRDKRLLLVLDNFEQILAAAPVVADLLAGASGLQVLVTSRASLHLRGEHEFPVPPLALPPHAAAPTVEGLGQYAAVRLFIASALAVKPDFVVTNATAPAVAEICARLDGLPLAIELAAARSKLLGPEALLARLEHRLPLLTGGARDLPARQQTLRATIAWSYDLLDSEEQRLFRRLAVFQGGATLDAISAVCNADADLALDLLDGLGSLVDKSLLRQDEKAEGEPRFGMLETVHEYAGEKLVESGEQAELERRHARYFLQLLERTQAELYGPQQAEWMARLESEHENFRTALSWASQDRDNDLDRLELGLRMVRFLDWLWRWRGHITEGRQWLAALLAQYERIAGSAAGAMPASLRGARAGALVVAGQLAWKQDDYDLARTYLVESLSISRELSDKRGTALALSTLGGLLCGALGDLAAADGLLQESLALFRALGDKPGIASVLLSLVGLADEQGDHALARTMVEESLRLNQELGHKVGIAQSLTILGYVSRAQHDLAAARSYFEEALRLHRDLHNQPGVALLLTYLGENAWVQGHYAASRACHEESLQISRWLGNRVDIANSILCLGTVAFGEGDYATARMLLKKSLPLYMELKVAFNISAALTVLAAVEIKDAGLSNQQGQSVRLGPQPSGSGVKVLRGVRLLGAAEGSGGINGEHLQYVERGILAQAMATARELLGEHQYEATRSVGQAMALDEAVAYALEETGGD
jgi:predicted ATPase